MPVDLAILIALEEEFATLRDELGSRWKPDQQSDGSYDYHWTDERGYRCVATFMGDMGPTNAAAKAATFLARTSPAVLVNIGIAGGIHTGVCIGDVVVPNEVQAYDQARAGDNFERRPETFKPTAYFISRVQNLASAHPDQYRAWQDAGAADLKRICSSSGMVTRPPFGALSAALRERPQICHVALASGSLVIASKEAADTLRKTNGNLKAAEMEAAGMLTAAEGRDVETLVLRGISDHVNVPKAETDAIGGGALRGLAMRNAWRLLTTMMDLEMLPKAGTDTSGHPPKPEEVGGAPVRPAVDQQAAVSQQTTTGSISVGAGNAGNANINTSTVTYHTPETQESDRTRRESSLAIVAIAAMVVVVGIIAIGNGNGNGNGKTSASTTTIDPINTGPITTGPVTTGPITTGPITTGPVTTGPITTDPTTTGPITTGPVTTDPTTTGPITTGDIGDDLSSADLTVDGSSDDGPPGCSDAQIRRACRALDAKSVQPTRPFDIINGKVSYDGVDVEINPRCNAEGATCL